jgi:hypothetical protein
MYESLLLPWSSRDEASPAELAYRNAGLLRTKGTIFMLPPCDEDLRTAFNAPPRPKTRMSSGAVALTKHFERNPVPESHPRVHNKSGTPVTANKGASSGGQDTYKAGKRLDGEGHPFWDLPTGSNENKTRMAETILNTMLQNVRWRNMMHLHEGVAVYEIRNARGFGMRWTLGLEHENGGDNAQDDAAVLTSGQPPPEDADNIMVGWKITKVTFRGFLEPIAGLDHELPSSEDNTLDSYPPYSAEILGPAQRL